MFAAACLPSERPEAARGPPLRIRNRLETWKDRRRELFGRGDRIPGRLGGLVPSLGGFPLWSRRSCAHGHKVVAHLSAPPHGAWAFPGHRVTERQVRATMRQIRHLTLQSSSSAVPARGIACLRGHDSDRRLAK
jgi:hypothetical protein